MTMCPCIYRELEQGARYFTRCTVTTRCNQGERGDMWILWFGFQWWGRENQ